MAYKRSSRSPRQTRLASRRWPAHFCRHSCPGVIAAFTAAFFILHTQLPGPNTDLSTLLKQNPGDYALSFGHFLDLNVQAMGAFRTPLLITAIALSLEPSLTGTFVAFIGPAPQTSSSRPLPSASLSPRISACRFFPQSSPQRR